MMQTLSPSTELLMATFRAGDGEVERLARAVAAMDGLMLPPHVASLRDAAQAWLAERSNETAWRGLVQAMDAYCRATAPRARAPRGTRPAAEDLAALADESPAWTERADLR